MGGCHCIAYNSKVMLETIIFTTVDLISFYWFPSGLITGYHFIIYLSQLVTSIFVKCFVEKVITHQKKKISYLSRHGSTRNDARMKFYFFLFLGMLQLDLGRNNTRMNFFSLIQSVPRSSARKDARMKVFYFILRMH